MSEKKYFPNFYPLKNEYIPVDDLLGAFSINSLVPVTGVFARTCQEERSSVFQELVND